VLLLLGLLGCLEVLREPSGESFVLGIQSALRVAGIRWSRLLRIGVGGASGTGGLVGRFLLRVAVFGRCWKRADMARTDKRLGRSAGVCRALSSRTVL
jgi:hypothetical protein